MPQTTITIQIDESLKREVEDFLIGMHATIEEVIESHLRDMVSDEPPVFFFPVPDEALTEEDLKLIQEVEVMPKEDFFIHSKDSFSKDSK